MSLSLLMPAFVLKNFIGVQNKVVIFHKSLGKITCVYTNREIAAKLCTGSLIYCSVERQRSYYSFAQVHVDYVPLACSLSTLSLIHDIVRICWHLLPAKIAVHELFDFLLYVYKHIESLSLLGQKVVLLRMFLLFDVLPHNPGIYLCARKDPYATITESEIELQKYILQCWSKFDQEIS